MIKSFKRSIFVSFVILFLCMSYAVSYNDLEKKEIVQDNIEKIIDNMEAIYSLLEGHPFIQNKVTKHLSKMMNYLENIEEIYDLENIIISNDSFKELKNSLERTEFSDDKLNLLRISTKNNYFSCEQIADLLETFDFSEDKLEAIRITYDKILDPENIYYIFNSFEYSTDVEKLEEMIYELENE